MGHYATWQDAYAHLDPEVYASPDMGRFDEFIEEAEATFDNELRLRFAVPFDRTLNPEAFEIARVVVGLRAAASYVIYKKQDAPGEAPFAFAKQLNLRASEWLARLKTPLVPTDSPDASSPYILRPNDGGGVARTTNAVFTNEHIGSPSGTHW